MKYLKLKKIFNILCRTIGLMAFAVFLIFPFLNNHINHVVAQSLWYPSLAIVPIVLFSLNKKNKKKTLYAYIIDGAVLPAIVLFLSIFIMNYYETQYNWYWTIFSIVAVGVPMLISGILLYNKNKNNPTKEQKDKANIRGFRFMLLWWVLDLFYMAIFMQWMIWQFIFGGLSMVWVFYNLIFVFLAGRKNNNLELLHDFIFGIGIMVYLIYIIPNKEIQNILIAVISAVYGGIITLVGIAWTIRDNRKDIRNSKLQKIKPMFSEVIMDNNTIREIHFTPEGTPRPLPGYDPVSIGMLENSNKIDFYINHIKINDTYRFYPGSSGRVKTNETIKLNIVYSEKYANGFTAMLSIRDIEDNIYEYKVFFDPNQEKPTIFRFEEIKQE